MHVYIYDDFLNKKKYDNTLAKIETRITDLGLSGKIIRLGTMRSSLSFLENEIKQGAKTIIAVGNDQTASKIVNSMMNVLLKDSLNPNLPFAYIPINDKFNQISECLGIRPEENACEVLSARRIEKIDIGEVSSENQSVKRYFISQAEISNRGTSIEIDKKYSLEIMEEGSVNIFNLPIYPELAEKNNSNPTDGLLEVCIQNKSKGFFKKSNEDSLSIFSTNHIKVTNNNHSLLLDNSIEAPTPATINVLRRKLNVIVGKGRKF